MQVVNYGTCVCTLYGVCDYYLTVHNYDCSVKFLYDEISTNFACKIFYENIIMSILYLYAFGLDSAAYIL